MTALADASVALRWFHARGEAEVEESRRLLTAHLDGRLETVLLDLTPYEVGNSLLRRHRWPVDRVEPVLATLADAHDLVRPEPSERAAAAALAETHGLSLYDATYAAVAAARGLTLVTADRELLDGLGLSATEMAATL